MQRGTFWGGFLCGLASLLALVPMQAAAQDYVVSSGMEGGYYHEVGSSLARELVSNGRTVQHETSQGSLANLARLDDAQSPVNVALAQADAVRRYLDEHPSFSQDLLVLDDVGKECVVLITRANGGIESAADLKKGSGLEISVDGPESGAAVTFELMGLLDPDFKNTKLQYMDSMEALLQLRRGRGQSRIAAVMLVQRPRTLSPALDIVLDNPDTFRIAPVRKGDMKTVSLPGGLPVYTEEKVRSGIGVDYSVSYETLCTRALLVVAKSKLSESMRRQLAQVMLESGSFIAPGRKQ